MPGSLSFLFSIIFPEGIDTFNCCYTINTECNATIFAHHDRTEHESNVEKQYESMYIWSILDEEYKMNSTADWRKCHCPFSNVCVTQLLYIGSVCPFPLMLFSSALKRDVFVSN